MENKSRGCKASTSRLKSFIFVFCDRMCSKRTYFCSITCYFLDWTPNGMTRTRKRDYTVASDIVSQSSIRYRIQQTQRAFSIRRRNDVEISTSKKRWNRKNIFSTSKFRRRNRISTLNRLHWLGSIYEYKLNTIFRTKMYKFLNPHEIGLERSDRIYFRFLITGKAAADCLFWYPLQNDREN